MIFLVANGLPFRSLIGCDILRKYSAIIDMSRAKITLSTQDLEWTAEIIGSKEAPQDRTIFHIRELLSPRYQKPTEEVEYQPNNDILWNEKIKEIRQFRSTKRDNSPNPDQIEMLINIYNRYRHVFSDIPGKVKNYQCVLKFKEPVNFNRKLYPIAYSLKEAVRTEINQLLKDDIIECSQSPYTSPIVAIKKKNRKVRLRLDAREINKNLINDRTSPGEIEEILKKFHGTQFISSWDTVCGYWQEMCIRDRSFYIVLKLS